MDSVNIDNKKDYTEILEGLLDIIKTVEKNENGFKNIYSYINEKCPELEKNLFKEVYFGKPYKTRDGRKALYCHRLTSNIHALIVEGDEEVCYFRYDGLPDDWDDSTMDSTNYADNDIVSEW